MIRERLAQRLMDLVALPTVNPLDDPPGPGHSEEPMVAYLEQWMSAQGFQVQRQGVRPGRENVVGVLRGRHPGPKLMLAGHTDTVGVQGKPELLTPRREGERIYGRGACDMKAAFACYLTAVEDLLAEGFEPAGDLYIAGVADEEYRMLGAKQLGQIGPRVDWVLIGEPTGLEVQIASRGRVVTQIVTHGRTAHSSVAELGVNAIYRMAPVIAALQEHAGSLLKAERHPLVGAPRLNVGTIQGGDQSNVVPDRCRIEVDRRTLPGERPAEICAELERVLARVREQEPSLDVTLDPEPVWVLDALDTPADSPLVRAALEAVRRVTGRPISPTGFPAGTDAPYFGAPALLCGPGDLQEAHTPNESIALADLEAATEVYKDIIRRLLQASSTTSTSSQGGPISWST